MIAAAAREASGYDKSLPTGRLIVLRLITALVAYFFISVRRLSLAIFVVIRELITRTQLFYCLMNLAFQLDVTRK